MTDKEEEEKQRTKLQNKALHKYFELLAESLNAAGYDMRKTLRHDIEIAWTPAAIKEHLWRGLQIAMTEKVSTADLNTKEITKVYDELNKHLGEKLKIHVPFPKNPEKP